MGMLMRHGVMGALCALVLITWSGCRSIVPVSEVRTDSTHTSVEVLHRDTVITVPADLASLDVRGNVEDLQRLLEDVRREQRVMRGEQNARLVLSERNGQLHIDCNCDSTEVKLKDAITTINRRNDRIEVLERTLTQVAKNDRSAIPGWMRGTIWLIVAIVVAIIIVFILLKSVFKII